VAELPLAQFFLKVQDRAMTHAPDIICIGALLWDVIGRTRGHMAIGDDMPGRITRRPGGVALNVAVALARRGLRPALLGAVGRDPEGTALIEACAAMGIETAHVFRSPLHPTDIYIAIEAEQGVVAAIADTAGLDAAGAAVLTPLVEGPLGRPDAPFRDTVAIDGNLSAPLITRIAGHPAFAEADLRVAPASPGKAARIVPLLHHPRATLYLNRAEAGMLAQRVFSDAREAAAALIVAGAHRVLVTDGAAPAVFAAGTLTVSAAPAPADVVHATGAGDALMAAHIAAERTGAPPDAALKAALAAAAGHVAMEPLS